MQLEQVAAELRPRGSWEAIDLGVALTRANFRLLLVSWLCTVVPLWALLLASTYWLPTSLVLLIIWWLKPLYDRVPLFVLSRTLFGAKPRIRDVVKAWPGMLWKRMPSLLFKRIPWLMVLPQFSWARSLLLPVVDLENQRGRGYSERRRVLVQFAGSPALMLMMVCGLYEVILVFGLLTLASQFAPMAQGATDLGALFLDAAYRHGDIPHWLEWSLIGGYLVSLTLVELFYVGGGFGLYLNCRTTLEGWDVELSFRRLARRIAQVSVILGLLLVPLTAHAAEQPLEKYADKAVIERVLKDPDFEVHKVTVKHWKRDRKEKPAEEDPIRDTTDTDLSWMAIAGRVLYYFTIVVIIGLLAWLIWINRHLFKRSPAAGTDQKTTAPRSVMGLDLTPESLPPDIARTARELWLSGNPRGALSLLYRGSLSWLVHQVHLPVRESDTENDCLRHTLTIPEPGVREYFAALTDQWVRTAYAQLPPASTDMESLLNAWPFSAAGRRGA